MSNMKPSMRPVPKLILTGIVVASGIFGVRTAMSKGWIPTPGILKSVVPQKANLPDVKDAVVEDVKALPMPTSSVACDANGAVKLLGWAWNSQMGLIYSNGGTITTKGSLMDKHGVCLQIHRQDDNGQMQADLVACASEIAKGSSDCSSGTNFVIIMGDGSGAFLGTLNAQLAKICKDCTAEIIGTTGFSRGEDKLMGPESWKKNPRSALGDGLWAGVLRDGDWDIGQKWIGDNTLKNNPDEKTYDADAINWVNAASYIDAAEKYVSGYCEDRKVVKDGRYTGETKNVCVKGVVTWTPGDVTVAMKKGGLVNIVSTKQYRGQMPSVIIGIKKWNQSHAKIVASMLAAALEGGDQVKAFPDVLKKAADLSAKVYNEQDGAYWMKYYKGVTERDATGMPVELGGSYASNMNDALAAFGLAGGNDNVKATYTIFKKIVETQYAELFKSTPIPDYQKVSDTSYLLQAKNMLENGSSEAESVSYTGGTGDVVSEKNVTIEFATGSAQLTSSGMSQVRQIKDDVAITGLSVKLYGHTDNTGNPDSNVQLSEDRAESVKQALQRMAPRDFPDSRFEVKGFGQKKPLAGVDPSTADGRSKNRRVEVILAN